MRACIEAEVEQAKLAFELIQVAKIDFSFAVVQNANQ
jgi:hypothetical protein